MKRVTIKSKLALIAGLIISSSAIAGSGELTLIHTGDIHGHLVPRPNVRSDTVGRMEGGLARMATVINSIRKDNVGKTIYFNTGDTLQGSAEAMFTRGQALIDVVSLLKPDFDEPGNWDYLYGTTRFLETFVGTATTPPLAPWNALAANAYYSCTTITPLCPATAVAGADRPALGSATFLDPTTPYPDRSGQRVMTPYKVVTVNGIKVGVLGMTTQRGIRVIGPSVTKGFTYTDGVQEVPYYINQLRNVEKVDVIVMISELELARTINLTENNPGIDFVLNADMHERTIKPIVVKTGTVLVEEGQDGTMLGEISMEVLPGHTTPGDGKLNWEWTPHIITDAIPEDPIVAAKVAQVRAPFWGKGFVPGQTVKIGGNTATLLRPTDTIVGYTAVNLHRSNFTDNNTTEGPGVIEGTSHDLIADAIHWAAGSDFATLRGFRYGTHVKPGPITMQDLYHYMPVGARIAKVFPAYGKNLKDQIENSARGTFDTNPNIWTGGWMFGYSGASFDLDVYQPYGLRGSNIKINGVAIDPADTSVKPYSVAGYWFADDPKTINNCGSCGGTGASVTPLVDESGNPLDVTEVVVRYLKTLPNMTANPQGHRINLLKALPVPAFSNPEIQPLRGAK